MADDQESHPQHSSFSEIEAESSQMILSRLKNWKGGSGLNWGESHARAQIYKAAEHDLERASRGEKLSGEEVLAKIGTQTSKLEERMTTIGTNTLSFDRVDRTTGEIITTEVRKEDDGSWIALEKRKSDESIIAQARISALGNTDLTLQYDEEGSVKRDANPDLTADSRFQEGTISTFELLSEEVLEKQLKGWIIQEIMDGNDTQGRMLYDAYRTSLFDREHAVGDTAITFQKALTSRYHLDRPAELNKLLSSLDSLYKQIGIEGYKPEIDVSNGYEGVIDEGERRQIINEAITRKALEDLDQYPVLFALKNVESYAEARAKVIKKEEDLRRLLAKDDIDRDEVRLAAYKLAREKRSLIKEVRKKTSEVGDEYLGELITMQLEGESSYVRGVPEELKPEDKQRLSEDAREDMIQKFFANEEFKYGNILADRLSQSDTELLFGNIAEIDYQIAGRKGELREAINSSPDTLCKIVSEIRLLQLQRKTETSKVRIKVVEKSGEDSEVVWKSIREEVGPKIVKYGLSGAKDSASRIVSGAREWLSSKGNLLKERFKANVEPTISKFSDLVSEGKEEAVSVLTILDKELLGTFKGQGQGVVESIKSVAQNTEQSFLRLTDDFERRKIIINKNLRVGLYETEMWFKEKKIEMFVNERAWAWEQQTKLGIFIGGEKVREQYRGRLERIKRVSEADFKRRVDHIQERQNPFLEVFQKDLEKRVKLIEKAKVEEITIPESVPVVDTPQVAEPLDQVLQVQPSEQTQIEEKTETENQDRISDDELISLIEENGNNINKTLKVDDKVLDGGNEEFDTSLTEFQERLQELRERTDSILDPNFDYSGLGEDYQRYQEYRTDLDQLKVSLTDFSEKRTLLVALLGEYQEQLQKYRELVKKMKDKAK